MSFGCRDDNPIKLETMGMASNPERKHQKVELNALS